MITSVASRAKAAKDPLSPAGNAAGTNGNGKNGKHDLPHSHITEKIIQAGFEVYKTLGPGFDDETYQKSLILEMEQGGMNFEVQRPIKVYYKNRIVNEYVIDLLVEHNVVVDVLCEKEITQLDIKRMKSYLNATKLDVGLILNFGAHMLEIKRVKP